MIVKFVKSALGYNEGELASFPELVAESLVKSGVVEVKAPVTVEPEVKAPVKRPPKRAKP